MRPKTKLIVAKPWVFVPARELSSFSDVTPGLYYRTEECVAQVPCPACGSEIGEPCKGKLRTYKVQACRERKSAACEDWIPRSGVQLARVEVHFNDLGDSRGPGKVVQHECVKVCWPVREKTIEELGGRK